MIFNGFISLILATLFLTGWPAQSLWIVSFIFLLAYFLTVGLCCHQHEYYGNDASYKQQLSVLRKELNNMKATKQSQKNFGQRKLIQG